MPTFVRVLPNGDGYCVVPKVDNPESVKNQQYIFFDNKKVFVDDIIARTVV
jgi:hypothetical protein